MSQPPMVLPLWDPSASVDGIPTPTFRKRSLSSWFWTCGYIDLTPSHPSHRGSQMIQSWPIRLQQSFLQRAHEYPSRGQSGHTGKPEQDLGLNETPSHRIGAPRLRILRLRNDVSHYTPLSRKQLDLGSLLFKANNPDEWSPVVNKHSELLL